MAWKKGKPDEEEAEAARAEATKGEAAEAAEAGEAKAGEGEKSGKKQKGKEEKKSEKELKKISKKMKGKKWFAILAPEMFGSGELGKTLAVDAPSMVGRKISTSMMEMTGDFKKYYIKISLRITGVKDEKALTEFAGSECLADYVSRMVYRKTRRVDTVQDLKTKDGKNIRVKTITILPRRVKSSIQTTVRNKVGEMMKAEVEASTLEEFVEKMLSDEIKNKILDEARRIYPVRKFEIRKTEVGK